MQIVPYQIENATKKIIFLLLFFIQIKTGSGQTTSDRVLLSPVGKKYLFYTELHGESAIVFHVGWWIDKGGSGNTIIYTDTVTKQSGTDGILFAGKKTTIRQEGSKLYIIATVNEKIKKIEIDTTSNTAAAYKNINNGYWWTSVNQLSTDIQSKFPLYHYGFRNGIGHWNSFENTSMYYKDFQVLANALIKAIYDSVIAIHTPYAALSDSLIKNITTIDYASLKTGIDKLPIRYSPESVYFNAVVKSVCHNRPELFFKLAEDMPAKKELLFDIAVYDDEINAKLAAFETNSPAKKEFLKARKEEKSMTRKAITAAAAGTALLAGILIALIK